MPELVVELGALQGHVHGSFEETQLVAAVVAHSFEPAAVNGLVQRKLFECVGKLYLSPLARFQGRKDGEYLRGQYVTTDYGQVGRGRTRGED